jgi:hypothetical protein
MFRIEDADQKKEINKKVGKGSTGARIWRKHLPPKRPQIFIKERGIRSQNAVRTPSLKTFPKSRKNYLKNMYTVMDCMNVAGVLL